jgi:hypothetical protein
VGIHLNHDEINGVARDRRSLLSNLTNGQLLMQSLNRLSKIIRAKQPSIWPVVYDDMFNPWQLYVGDQDNMQAEWYHHAHSPRRQRAVRSAGMHVCCLGHRSLVADISRSEPDQCLRFPYISVDFIVDSDHAWWPWTQVRARGLHAGDSHHVPGRQEHRAAALVLLVAIRRGVCGRLAAWRFVPGQHSRGPRAPSVQLRRWVKMKSTEMEGNLSHWSGSDYREISSGEWTLGFRVVGCPYDDDNMTQLWANQLGEDPGGLGWGLMDTDWSKTGNGMAFTAYTAWNNHNKTLPVTWEKWGVRRPTALGVWSWIISSRSEPKMESTEM